MSSDDNRLGGLHRRNDLDAITGVRSYARLDRMLARDSKGVCSKALHTLAACDRAVYNGEA